MISKDEVLQKASAHNVNPIIIEKDYILGWILAGISNHPVLASSWVFKGGTCLKKCYFGNYRFSEDLDFTLKKESITDPNFIRSQLTDVRNWLYENTGIEIPEIILDIFPDSNEKTLRGKLGYVGPLDQRGSFTRIKLDLTKNEFLAKPSVKSMIFHPYEDQQDFSYHTQAYSYEEIFAEKIRALFERARPRDLYDVINLFERKGEFSVERTVLKDIVERKFSYRKLPAITEDSSITNAQEQELIQDWRRMLEHQLGHLDPVQDYIKKLPKVITWILS